MSLPVSVKKNFEVCLLCSSVLTLTPEEGPVLTPGASYEEPGRGPQGEAIYQISKL